MRECRIIERAFLVAVVQSLDDSVRFLHEDIVLSFMPRESLIGVFITWCVFLSIAASLASCIWSTMLRSIVSATFLAAATTLACFPCIHLFGEFVDSRRQKRRAAKLEALQEDGQMSKGDISAGVAGRQRYCMCARDFIERISGCHACSNCVGVCCGVVCAPCKMLGGVALRGAGASQDIVALRVQEMTEPFLPEVSSGPSTQSSPLASPRVGDADADQLQASRTGTGAVWRRCTVPRKPSIEQLHSALVAKFRPAAPPGAAHIDCIICVPDNVLLESDEDCAILKHGDSLFVRFAKPGAGRNKAD